MAKSLQAEPFKLSCVLFDLDGTLVDTSADLLAALNHALIDLGIQPPSSDQIKPYISFGVEAMLRQCLSEPIEYEILSGRIEKFLNYYQANIATHSQLFEGMLETLETIEQQKLKWGVITNKRQQFTVPLMEALALTNRAACIVSGDTTGNSKPHPEPMLKACQLAEVVPTQCVYIGDARHDILAGQSVNMKTLAATYGYLKSDDCPEKWGADALMPSPRHINTWIEARLCH